MSQLVVVWYSFYYSLSCLCRCVTTCTIHLVISHVVSLLLAVLILLFIIYSRRRRPEAYAVGMDPDDDVRENMINYNEEGVGELGAVSHLYENNLCVITEHFSG